MRSSDSCYLKRAGSIRVATIFSGVGAPEQACKFLEAGCRDNNIPATFECVAACENDPKRQPGLVYMYIVDNQQIALKFD